MQDEPTPDEILESVAEWLREVAISSLPARLAFDARVAANALELVRRQIALHLAPTAEAGAERQRLTDLLGTDGELAALNQLLCTRIAAGELGLAHRPLMEHLWTTTLAKLAVDQPSYASYRRALAERGQK